MRREFKAFFSSCYLGVRKPDEGIYKLALEVTQRDPEESLFIDDRELNLECAKQLGMRTIHFQNAAQLRQDLAASGVSIPVNINRRRRIWNSEWWGWGGWARTWSSGWCAADIESWATTAMQAPWRALPPLEQEAPIRSKTWPES